MPVRSAVISTIRNVAAENDKSLPLELDHVELINSGLDSLCLAVIVARLEDELGVDPFSGSGDIVYPTTIGDFVNLYANAVA